MTPLRRTIIIACTKDGRTTPRLFRMSHAQATVFREVLLATPGDPKQAEMALERTVVRMLSGQMPTEEDHPVLVRLGTAFKRIPDRHIDALPRAGCPEGWIECVVMQLQTPNGPRAICYDLSKDQQRAFNDAIVAVQEVSGCGRDEAWLGVQRMVGRFLGGAKPQRDAEDLIVDLASAFREEKLLDILVRNRVADEQDVARWSFTRAPLETT